MTRKAWTPILTFALALLLLAACSAEIRPANVNSVTIQQREGVPVAVVQGEHPDACAQIGAAVQTVENDTIKVGLVLEPTPPDLICAQVITPFTEVVPLDTSGLSAGSYVVNANGVTAPLQIGPQTAEAPPPQRAPVASVEIEQREDTAVLIISGDMPDPCHEIGDVTQRVQNGTISVDVAMTPPAPDTVCAQVIVPYTVEVPIEARLEPGEYTVKVNDEVVDVTVK
jgi:hypothetical protein